MDSSPKFIVQDIPIRQITISPVHFEREHSDNSIDEMSDSVNRVGVINPLSVRKLGKVYELLAGERRLKAAKKSGAKVVSCKVYVGIDDYKAELISIEENYRGTSPMSMAEKKKAVDRVIELTSIQAGTRQDDPDETRVSSSKCKPKGAEEAGREKASKVLGISKSQVVRLRHMEKLVPAAKDALSKGNISMEQAEKLSGYSAKKQHDKLPKMIRESDRETRNREGIEKLTDTQDLRVAKKIYSSLVERCEEACAKIDALLKALSPELVDFINKQGVADLVQTRAAIKELLTQIRSSGDWSAKAGVD